MFAEQPRAVLILSQYEADNLVSALGLIMEYERSPIAALNSGDWVGQLRYRLLDLGADPANANKLTLGAR